MLTQVVIQTSTPMSLDIDAVDPDEILILTSISGLSNTKTNLFLGEFAREGGYYQGRRTQPLNPVFNFKINPDYANDVAVSDVREMLYRMFMEPTATSDAVQVLLKDDRKPDRYFKGYTEAIESDIFVKEMTAQVSMLTTDPYLRSAEETTDSNLGGWFQIPLNYEGTADTGFEVTMQVLADAQSATIFNNERLIGMTIDAPMVTGDIIYINTNQGSRAVRLNDEDIMGALTSNSQWLMLQQAANTLRSYGDNIGDQKVAVTSYKYRAAWWGI